MEKNLELDVDTEGRGESAERVARVAVAASRAFTRHSGAPVLTSDCPNWTSLKREVERLKGELDEALDEAKAAFGEEGDSAPQRQPEVPQAASAKTTLPTDLTVADVMSRDVRTLGPNDPVSVADELMRQGRFRHVVVVEDDKVVGVVSQRDIFFGALSWVMGEGRRYHDQRLAATKAKDVMCARVATIDADAPLKVAAALLRERKIGCLPVVEAEQLVGVLTEGDFLSLLAG